MNSDGKVQGERSYKATFLAPVSRVTYTICLTAIGHVLSLTLAAAAALC